MDEYEHNAPDGATTGHDRKRTQKTQRRKILLSCSLRSSWPILCQKTGTFGIKVQIKCLVSNGTAHVHPSGLSTSSFNRLSRGGGSRSHHSASINPTSSRSRKCVRSLSRNEVSFIRTSASRVTSRKASVFSDSDTSGAGAGFSGRTFSPANTTCTASRALAFGPSKK